MSDAREVEERPLRGLLGFIGRVGYAIEHESEDRQYASEQRGPQCGVRRDEPKNPLQYIHILTLLTVAVVCFVSFVGCVAMD